MIIFKRFVSIVGLTILLEDYCIAECLPEGFVYLHHIDKTIAQELLLATDNNFVGAPLDKYEGNQAICTEKAAFALRQAQRALKKSYPHWCLQIQDAYRPVSAVEHIKRWARDLKDQKSKAKYYPNIDKKDLLGAFVAAKQSPHSRGSTFDVLIINEKTNESLDFGPDFFGDSAHFDYPHLTSEQKKNRQFLRKLMIKHGFKPYNGEFWHFVLKDEPFPTTYFDFKICNAKE